MVKAFFFSPHPATWTHLALLTAPWSLRVCVCAPVCCHDAVNERMCFVVFLYVTQCLGIDVTEWFNFMPNDWTLSPRLGLCFKGKKCDFFSLLEGFLSVCCIYFQSLIFTWMRNHSVKTDIHLKGFEDIPAAWLHEAAFMKNRVVDSGRSFSCDFPVGERTDPKLTVQMRVLFFPIGQSALCKYGTIHLQLYLAVCTIIVATVWAVYSVFLYLRSSKKKTKKTPTIYCMFVIHFCLFSVLVLASSPLPLRAPAPEGSILQISVLSGHFHPKNLQDTTLKWL